MGINLGAYMETANSHSKFSNAFIHSRHGNNGLYISVEDQKDKGTEI